MPHPYFVSQATHGSGDGCAVGAAHSVTAPLPALLIPFPLSLSTHLGYAALSPKSNTCPTYAPRPFPSHILHPQFHWTCHLLTYSQQKPTYKALMALRDNYSTLTGTAEVETAQVG